MATETTEPDVAQPQPPPIEPAVAIPSHLRPNEYETIYVLRPDVDPDMGDRIAARLAEVIDRYKGKLIKVDNWGKRRLAFTVAKQQKGIYVFSHYLGYAGLVQEIERNLKVFDVVVKYQTVRIGRMVDPASFEVKPEDVQFKRIEHLPETEESQRPETLGVSPERSEEAAFLEGTLDEPPLPEDMDDDVKGPKE